MFGNTVLIFLFLLGLSAFGQDHQKYVQSISGSSLEITMVPIPAGTFTMGSVSGDADAKLDESPSRILEIPAFWMADAEITWELYKMYLNRTGQGIPESDSAQSAANTGNTVSINPDAISGATIPYVDMSLGMGSGPGMPVGNVTRKAAAQFCKWLSAKTGHFYRLPTEAEWEYAARAGSTTPYFYGTDTDRLNDFAWYASNSGGTYHVIKTKQANPWGLFDILGNVDEWTMDAYAEKGYPLEIQSYVPPVKEYPGVLRGGSYKATAEALRVTARLASNPVWKQRDPQFPRSKWRFTDAPFAGFRVVRPVNPPNPAEFESYWDLP